MNHTYLKPPTGHLRMSVRPVLYFGQIRLYLICGSGRIPDTTGCWALLHANTSQGETEGLKDKKK